VYAEQSDCSLCERGIADPEYILSAKYEGCTETVSFKFPLPRTVSVAKLFAGSEFWESSREELQTFDSFLECLHEQKIEKVYRNCKFQISSPAHTSPRVDLEIFHRFIVIW